MASLFRSMLVPFGVYSTAYLFGTLYGLVFLFTLLVKILENRSFNVLNINERKVRPECLDNPELGRHMFAKLENITLHYVEKGDRNKPLILFLHGFPDFWYSWRHQLKEFSKEYWTVAVDLRGFGESEKPKRSYKYHMKHVMQDVKQLIEYLGKEKCILITHDWGSIIGFYFTHNYPHMVDSYVASSSGHPEALLYALATNVHQFLKFTYILFFNMPVLPELLLSMNDMEEFDTLFKYTRNVNKEDIEAYKYTFSQPGSLTAGLNYYRQNLAPHYELLKEHDKNFRWPRGLMLIGGRDEFVEFAVLEKTQKIVNNLEIGVIENGTHFLQSDEMEVFNKQIWNFLNQKTTR